MGGPRIRSWRRQSGVGYMGLLIFIAIVGVTLGAVADVWSTTRQREKEQELIWIGDQFRQAVRSYYESSPGATKQYPAQLDDLLSDKRFAGRKRHLRRIYIDPITGTKEWGLVFAQDGGIAGVHSKSEAEVLKRVGFRPRDVELEEKQRYAEWQFVYMPAASPPGQTPPPGTPPAPGTSPGAPPQRMDSNAPGMEPPPSNEQHFGPAPGTNPAVGDAAPPPAAPPPPGSGA